MNEDGGSHRRREDTLRYLAGCDRQDLAILGVEGFMPVSDGLRVEMDYLRDYGEVRVASWVEFRRATIAAASAVVEQAPEDSGVVFDITTCDEQWWKSHRRQR